MPRKRNARRPEPVQGNAWSPEDPVSSLRWDAQDATYEQALTRYRLATGEEPVTRYHSYTHALKILTARCQSCGRGVAYLAISRATPWRTTLEASRYAFWQRFTALGKPEACPHLGTLPNPSSLHSSISAALRTTPARLAVQSIRDRKGELDPSTHFDGAATKFYVSVEPCDP